MRLAGAPWICVLCLALSACGPGFMLPLENHVRAQDIEALMPGRTTRADVLLSLGNPDARYRGDAVFCYRWSELLAFVRETQITEEVALLMAFDASGNVRRVEKLRAFRGKTLAKEIDAWVEQERGAVP